MSGSRSAGHGDGNHGTQTPNDWLEWLQQHEHDDEDDEDDDDYNDDDHDHGDAEEDDEDEDNEYAGERGNSLETAFHHNADYVSQAVASSLRFSSKN